MPVSRRHRQVAAIALEAAAGHVFALRGGNALLAHGIITRPTRAEWILSAPGGEQMMLQMAYFDRQPACVILG